jgi:hypothetical protein
MANTDPHAGHDISVTQVLENGKVVSSQVHCDTCDTPV